MIIKDKTMNFYIYFINRIRVIIKSFLKYEKKIEQYLTYLKWKKRIKNSELTDIDFNDNLDQPNSESFWISYRTEDGCIMGEHGF